MKCFKHLLLKGCSNLKCLCLNDKTDYCSLYEFTFYIESSCNILFNFIVTLTIIFQAANTIFFKL